MNLLKIYKNYMATSGSKQEFQYKYYNNDESVITVFNREITKSVMSEGNLKNEAMHIDFYNDIISRKVGYMASDITLKTEDEVLALKIKEFESSTKQATSNMDSVSLSSISGISHRLVYTQDGVIKIKNIPGWQVVYDYTNDIYDPDFAYYYYIITDIEGVKVYHCDVYSRTEVSYFTKNKDGDYVMIDGPQLHNFNIVPIIPFINNTSKISDCNSVIPLMNNYDIITSDTADELKATRLTYLKIWGDLYTGQDSEGNEIPLTDWLTQGRAMIFGPDEDGRHSGDAQFLSKTIDDEAVQNMLKLIRTHIYEGSGSVDLKELTDKSDARVFSIQAAISRLENNAKVTENYTKMGLFKQYKLVFYFWSEAGQGNYTVSDIEITFKRNFVKDDAALTDTLLKAMNVMSVEDAYEQSGLFEDVDAAVQRYEAEQSGIPEGQNANEIA